MNAWCSCWFDTDTARRFTPEWHRRHMAHHFAVFPSAATNKQTVANLLNLTTTNNPNQGGK